jgi:hypothetical protein
MRDQFFRVLTEEEIKEFERYAREHDPILKDWAICHPVCRRVWTERGLGPKESPDLEEGR